MKHDLEHYSLWQWLVPFFMSLFGGLAGYLNYVLQYRRKFSWREFACKIFISIFTGATVLLLSDSFDLTEYERGAVTGFAAWLGAETMGIIRSYFKIEEAKRNEKT